MISYLAMGVVLGLSAGFAPGPLMTLVVSETLQHNTRSGIKVALAPLVTDLPIVLFSLLILAKLAEFQVVLGIISLGGAVFLLLLGWQSLRVKTIELCIEQKASQSLLKGVLANFLSPHPYLFWISVGGPMMIRATQIRLSAGVVFICGFYLCLIGAKIFLAILVGQSKSFLSGACYPRIIRSLGILLILLAGLLFYDGLKLLQFY